MKNKQALIVIIELLRKIECENSFDSYVIKKITYILQGLYDRRVISLKHNIKRFSDDLPDYLDTV